MLSMACFSCTAHERRRRGLTIKSLEDMSTMKTLKPRVRLDDVVLIVDVYHSCIVLSLTYTRTVPTAKLQPDVTGPSHLLLSCKIGAARELKEETGMDLRDSLERLIPVALRAQEEGSKELSCELKKRVFFSVDITDEDLFVTKVCGD
jgi:8-oxo-dGTP pyrophosphatase MutT (NUDIX family)